MAKENINDIVHTLSKMKSLQELDILSSRTAAVGYKLTPEELSLFKDFPVNDIEDDALDLKKENLAKFRKVLLEFKDFNCEYLFDIMDKISD